MSTDPSGVKNGSGYRSKEGYAAVTDATVRMLLMKIGVDIRELLSGELDSVDVVELTLEGARE